MGHAMLLEDLITVLETSQQFDEIPDVERRAIVIQAVMAAAQNPPIKMESLMYKILKHKEEYLNPDFPDEPLILA
jgi:hypothetical protein